MRKKSRKTSSFFCLILLIAVCSYVSMAQARDFKGEAIRQEIQCLNLVNGLELEEKQVQLVLENAREAERLRRQFNVFLSELKDELRKNLNEIKACLHDHREIPQPLGQRYHRLANVIRKAKLRVDEQVRGLALEVENDLKDHQIFTVEKYIPCIIPPKGESRIGQAENHKAMTRGLEKIRRVPYRIYQRRRHVMAERTLSVMKLRVPRGAYLDEKDMTRDILSIYDRTRRMDEQEFEVQKESLAQELHELVKPTQDPQKITHKIERFLLAKEIVPILQKRLLPH